MVMSDDIIEIYWECLNGDVFPFEFVSHHGISQPEIIFDVPVNSSIASTFSDFGQANNSEKRIENE